MTNTLLRQAFDALHPQANRAFVEATKDALREALAQPAPEPVAWDVDGCLMYPADYEFSRLYGMGKPLIAAPPAAPAPVVPSFDRTTALVLLQAASKSGDPGAIGLAAQLAGAAPCKDCGYVNFKCRCQSAAPVVREPLNGDQLWDLWRRRGEAQPFVDFCPIVRDVERAHGIGGGGNG